MKILLIKNRKIYNYDLPREVKDNFWITDYDSFDNLRNLINVEASNGKWILKSNYETRIMSTERIYDTVDLNIYNFYTIKNDNEKNYFYLYCEPSCEENVLKFQIIGNGSLNIGRNSNCNIIYPHMLVDENHAKLTYNNGEWYIEDNNSQFGTYVNNIRISGQQKISYSDAIFIVGLKINVIKDLIIVNNIENKVKIASPMLVPRKNNPVQYDQSISKEEELDLNLYMKDDYFYRSPRFIEDVYKEEIIIEDPPAKLNAEETPLILSIGPMFTMAITSLTTASVTINNIVSGETTWKKSAPSLVIAGAMFCSMLIWPVISRVVEKKRKKKKEAERIKKYTEYINEKEEDIQLIIKKQTQTLKDKYLNLSECQNIIFRKKSNLWERGLNQDDFLTLRLGIGNMPIVADLKYSPEKFTLEEDELKELISNLVNKNKMLLDVPITVSFIEKHITSIIGSDNLNYEFFKGLFLQMMTFHSYEYLKLVVLTNHDSEYKWNYLRNIPYIFDNNHQMRFLATDIDETKEVSLYLEKIYQDRQGSEKFNYKNAKEYYVIVTDNYHAYRDIEIIKDILKQTSNMGFSLIILSDKLQNLPSECRNFISVGRERSGIFESEIAMGHQKEFATEFCNSINLNECIKKISNTPIEIISEDQQLPGMVSFLQLYNVGKVEQLNVANRWHNNNSKKSLAVPVGIEKSGTLLKLDLHEKYHGPHGLIAGMTGSGKSEFIITYILSLAINFSPEDVSFILIDYKGGGLAGAFENRETGVKLPHLAGTITNLDVTEINRSLASIKSELRRRQEIFNQARDRLGESTVDIYKYQSFYKDGLVKEPVPHLFIISDEFAELKSQQPDFMDELISTARIGRSLGIHLILATQKPSGVVNDQIWSNSRFRVCLKVQEKSDSNEMIKCPDAAFLKNVGRFYLQVGYNELFALGQSAWCGAQYYPKEKIKKKIDQALYAIDDIGSLISVQDADNTKFSEKSMGEELANILKHIIEVSKETNIKAKPLWLPKIAAEIYLNFIKSNFEYSEKKYVLNPLIGLYDDPNNQSQQIVTLPLTEDGNRLIYGSSGSGKELLLTTMIYSLITEHGTDEVNLYIIDFGAGTLKMFAKAPHVGDVILSTEEEKIQNLFKSIDGELAKRKKLFSEYNGDYLSYIKKSGKTLPYNIIVINNYDSFIDTFDYSDKINQISRECSKYGIIFVFTVNGATSVRYRIKQNFKSDITLQFNNPDDYSSILGNIRNRVPSSIYGRGFIKKDAIYEFQTAYVTKKDEIVPFIENICKDLSSKYSYKAKKIPVVPDVVNAFDYIEKSSSLKQIVLGISKENVSEEYFDFLNNYTTLVSAMELESIDNFVESLTLLLSNVVNLSLNVIDTSENLKIDDAANISITTNNFDEIAIRIIDEIELKKKEIQTNGVKTLVDRGNLVNVIYGFDKFLSKLSDDIKKKFVTAISDAKEFKTISFILADSATNFKKYEFETWYRSAINNTSGVWIGSGVSEQSAIKVSIPYSNKTINEIKNTFGVVIKNNKPSMVKLIKKEVEIV